MRRMLPIRSPIIPRQRSPTSWNGSRAPASIQQLCAVSISRLTTPLANRGAHAGFLAVALSFEHELSRHVRQSCAEVLRAGRVLAGPLHHRHALPGSRRLALERTREHLQALEQAGDDRLVDGPLAGTASRTGCSSSSNSGYITASLVGKYRKNVRGATLARSAMSLIEVSS